VDHDVQAAGLFEDRRYRTVGGILRRDVQLDGA
jgi:hypothetical protein